MKKLEQAQVQKLLDELQEAQFMMYVLASALNKSADAITEAVKEAGITVKSAPPLGCLGPR